MRFHKAKHYCAMLLLVGLCTVIPSMEVKADGPVKAIGKWFGGFLGNQAQSYAEDNIRNQVPGQQQNTTVSNPINYVANNISPKETMQTLTQDNGYRHSSMEFTYKAAAADNYMGQFVPGGDSAINSGAIKGAMENQHVKDMLNNPELDNLPGLTSADTMVNSVNQTTYDGFNFYLNLDKNPDYKDKNFGEQSVQMLGDTICGTFINIENTGKSIGKAWKQFTDSMSHQSDTDSNHQTWVTRFLADPTNSKGKTSQGAKVDSSTGAKKPNIYLYGEAGQEVRVEFESPELLTAADPDYPAGGWTVILDGRGRLRLAETDAESSGSLGLAGQYGLGGDIVAEDGSLGYLFYESEADSSLLQTEEAWVISPQGRWEALYALMTDYGFNDAEATDFADFWDAYLRQNMAYLFYPQTTELIDVQMPLKVTPRPEHSFRLWFALKEYKEYASAEEAAGLPVGTPEIAERAVHEGYALTEWGIVFLSEKEFEACKRK